MTCSSRIRVCSNVEVAVQVRNYNPEWVWVFHDWFQMLMMAAGVIWKGGSPLDDDGAVEAGVEDDEIVRGAGDADGVGVGVIHGSVVAGPVHEQLWTPSVVL